jgi:O-antigen ligase
MVMNGKRWTGLNEVMRQTPALRNAYPAPAEIPENGDLEKLSRSELIQLVNHLRAKLRDFASPVARLLFAFTIAALPWRLRVSILPRPQGTIFGDYTDFLLFLPDILLLLTLSLWLLSLLLRPRPIALGPAFISLPLVGVTLVGLVSVVASSDPVLSLYHSLRLLFLFGFYLYVVNEIHTIGELALPAALLVFPQAVVGILQVLLQRSVHLQALGEYPLDPAWSGVSIAWANGVNFLRAYGLSDHPNILGGCLAFALLILSVKYVTSQPTSWDVILSAFFGLGSLALLMTLSRSAWLAFLAGSLLAGWLFFQSGRLRAGKRWLALYTGSSIFLIPFLLYLAPYLGVRLGFNASFENAPLEQQSLGERQLLNQAANRLFSDQPLTGTGLGAFPVSLRERFPDFPVDYQPAHLVLLDAAAETGIFGALFYALLLISPWLALWLSRRQIHLTPSLIGSSALLFAVSLVGLFDYYTWLLVPGRLVAWLSWGLWGSFYLSARRSERRHA